MGSTAIIKFEFDGTFISSRLKGYNIITIELAYEEAVKFMVIISNVCSIILKLLYY